MKKKGSFSLNKKLVVLVIAVSALAIILTAALFFNFASSILLDNIKSQLVDESNTRGIAVEFFIENRIRQMQGILANPVIKESIIELSKISDPEELNSKIMQKHVPVSVEIRNFQLQHGNTLELTNLEIVSKSGIVFFSLNEPSELTQQANMDIATPFAEFVPAETAGNKKMVLYVPFLVQKNGEFENLGTIIATMGTSSLDRILLDRYGLQQTGEVYLVNENRLMISDSIFVKNTAFRQKVDTLPVGLCFEEGKSIEGTVYKDYRGVDIFGISYCAKDKGLVLLTEIDENEVLLPLFDLQEKIVYLGLIITASVSAIAYFLSTRLSKPIIKLTDAADEIAKGNFDIKTNIKTKDEIGQLSSSFDLMAEKLRESIFAIRQREDIIKQQEEILLQFSESSENSCVCLVDVVQSTKITSKLSDSDSTKFYSTFINSMANIVRKHGGVVVKNIGDALLFYFPNMLEGKPEQFKKVLDCCMEMSESHDDIGKKMEEENLPKFDYKISATYGTVRVAKVSTSSVNDIFGSTVNRCSKINGIAPINGLVIGEDFYKIAKTLEGYSFSKIVRRLEENEYGFAGYAVSRKSS